MRNPILAQDLPTICRATPPLETVAGKTVLITGANGFLPAYMVETLLYRNEVMAGPPAKVIGLVRSSRKAGERFGHHRDRSDLQVIVQDVCQPVSVDGAVDYVVHAASPASPRNYGKDPVGTLAPNVFGTRNLLELAKAKQSEGLLFLSSAEVYGEVEPDELLCREETYGVVDPTQIRSCYAESKRMGETLCVAWFHQYGVPARIVRPFHTYGPGMALDDGRVFCDFVADVVHRRAIAVRSKGDAVRAYCYVSDAVAAFFTVLFQGENGQAYNVGNNRAVVSVLQLALMLAALFPERVAGVNRLQDAHLPDYLASKVQRVIPDTRKLEALGWQPEQSLESGFRRTVLSYLLENQVA